MSKHWRVLIFLLAATASSFVAGAYLQHVHANWYLQILVQNDPYAHYVSSKILKVLRFFGTHNSGKTRLQQIMKYGYPGLDDVRLYTDFVLSYDRRNRVAHWVCEHLRPESFHSTQRVHRSHSSYQPDMSVPSNFRSVLEDYQRSGFDRGHLAAAGNHYAHQTHCNETFYLTNIAPQIGKGFNQAAWNKLEIYVRDLTLRYGSVYVCTGPLYKPKKQANDKWSIEYEMIGTNMVAVPTHFFKVILLESKLELGKPYMEAYVLPNQQLANNISLREFLCDIREIEHIAGLQFYNGLRRSALFGSNYPSASLVFENFR